MREPPSRRISALVLILLVGLMFPATAADTPQSTPEIVFSDDHGLLVPSTLELNGSSNFPLRDTSWVVVDLGSTTPVVLLNGPHLTSVTPVSDERFEWTLSIDTSELSCVCYIGLTPESGPGSDEVFRLTVYIGDASQHRPVLFSDVPGELHSLSPTNNAPVSNGLVSLSYHAVMSLNSWNSAQVMAEICEAPGQVCREEAVPIAVVATVQATSVQISVDLSAAGYADGVWLLQMRLVDQVLRHSNTMMHLVILDTTEPSLALAAPNSVYERSLIHVLANVDDGYDGARTTATWSLMHNNDTIRTLYSSELIDQHHAVLNLSVSGHYDLQVIVQDRAGFTTTAIHEFEVENIRPHAVLSVDGFELGEGQTVVVGPELNWSIQAFERDDNEPVDYLWVIDNTTSVRGAQQLNASLLDGVGVHDVELIVFDDDGSTDRVSVKIEILSPPEDAISSTDGYLWFGVGLLGVLMIGFFTMIHRDTESDDLPKWSKRNPNQPDDEG